ncbi:MAG TPA: isoprenylcysteine carboxylmethyltransferase family protein, partial [Limnochordia bacterium]|nr:isoprenylcysteine carboxylmethyltransferase family protein [Limnochordia bacterium]
LLFVPAGTLDYWNAWLLLAILYVPMLIVGAVLLVKNPELLRKRLKARENEVEQKRVIFLSGLMFVAGFAVAGLDYRFQWLVLPGWLVTAAAVVFVVGYLLFVEVMRENEYLSRTVEVQEDQTVVDSGLYGVIRHPMYAATILMFMAMPLVLGSFFSFLVFLLYPVITVMRIRNEEEVLEKNLKGYAEYKKRVKYRLIPFVW